jgi:hypothetical protein
MASRVLVRACSQGKVVRQKAKVENYDALAEIIDGGETPISASWMAG